MRVSGQRHAPAAIYPRERTPGIRWTVGWSWLMIVSNGTRWTELAQDHAQWHAVDGAGSGSCPVARGGRSWLMIMPSGTRWTELAQDHAQHAQRRALALGMFNLRILLQ
jgi:hypothetical protein